MPLFEARHLHKRFGDQVVLEDVSLSFEANRLSAIMGPNGAGKTTCFNVLTGQYRPDRGRVIFDGEDITGLAPRKIARLGVARSFQSMNLFDEYTALENVLLAVPIVRARGLHAFHDLRGNRAARRRAWEALSKVGLADRMHTVASELAYGERRALEIGMALAMEPRLLFLDEPTSGLGTDATRALAGWLGEIRKSVTIVVIEHNMRFLFELADFIHVVHWGQVIASGSPDELRADKWVQASNLGALA